MAVILANAPVAQASVFSFISDLFTNTPKALGENNLNSQNIALLEAPLSISPTSTLADVAESTAVDDKVLLAEAGPLGTLANIATDIPAADQISIYTVRKGDSLSAIADLFKVSVDTIRWANDLKPGEALKEDQVLVILPISGVIHTVKKGDTVDSLAKLYKSEPEEIISFNDLGGNDLTVGDSIIIPHGRVIDRTVRPPAIGRGLPIYAGYFLRPILGGRRTQGLHGHNGVDLASYYGAPIMAAAAGEVIVSRFGWNGGYGNLVVIQHPNGTQTLYGHTSENLVRTGQKVTQGQIVAKMGSTGRSTGTHLHFEVHGAKNPF